MSTVHPHLNPHIPPQMSTVHPHLNPHIPPHYHTIKGSGWWMVRYGMIHDSDCIAYGEHSETKLFGNSYTLPAEDIEISNFAQNIFQKNGIVIHLSSNVKDLKTKEPKMESKDVWLVKIEMPRRFLENFDDRSLEVAGEKLDIEALNKATDEGLDDQSEAKQQGQDINAPEPAEAIPPAGPPA